MRTRTWMLLFIVGAALWYFWGPLMAWMNARLFGAKAATDFLSQATYTTYNTQLYGGPVWAPLARFFRADAYVPSQINGDGSGQPANYSVQG